MNIRLVFCFSLLLGSTLILCSQSRLDSLENRVETSVGSEKVEARVLLAKALLYTQPNKAVLEIKTALDDARAGGFEQEEASAMIVYGALLNELGQFYKAEETLQKAIALAEENGWKSILCTSQLSLGTSYIRIGNYTKAAEAHFEGMGLAREINDSDLELTHLMNLGVLKIQLGLLDEANQFLNEALETSIAGNDLFRQGQIYGNLGYLEYMRQNIGNSKDYHQKSLDLFLAIGDKLQAANSHNNLGFAYGLLNQFDLAESQYQKALEIYEELGDTAGTARVLINEARLEKSKGNLSEAINLSKVALETSANLGFNSALLQLYQFQFEVYEEMSQFKNSLNAFKHYSQVKDSITIRTNNARIADLTAKYDFEKLAREAEIKQQESEIQELKLRQRNQLLIGTGLFLFLLTIVLLWNRSVLKGKLSLSRKEIDLRSKEHELEKHKLVRFAEELAVKNETLETQAERDKSAVSSDRNEHEQIDILEKLSSSLVDEKDWKKFNIYFDALYPDFYESIKERSKKKLTLNEKRLAALIKLELTNKEIGSILNISRNSVVKAKYRFRQHLGLKETKEMEDLIVSL